MKLKFTRIALLLLLTGTSSMNLYAQSNPTNVITTAVPFLRVAPDARAAGMGDVGIATTPDVNSSFYNMGKIAFNTSKSGIGFTYTPWLPELDRKSSYLLAASYFYKLDDMQAISGAVRYLSQGNFDLRDELGNQTTSFKPTDLALEAGYSRKLSMKTGIGLSIRYINSKLADNSGDIKNGSSVAADLGFFYTGKKGLGNGWNFGAALTNLGAKIGYTKSGDQKDYIPANLGLGTTYTKLINEDNKISFGLDLNKLLVPTPPEPTDAVKMQEYRDKGVVGSWFSSFGDAPGGFSEEIKEFQLSLGAEYTYKDMISFRTGFFSENEDKGNRKYFTVGAGYEYNIAGLNLSYLIPTGSASANNPLKNTFRLSLMFDLNKNNNSKK